MAKLHGVLNPARFSQRPIPSRKAKPDEVYPEIEHVGGGWYELPNGEKVQGKEAALAALAALEDLKSS